MDKHGGDRLMNILGLAAASLSLQTLFAAELGRTEESGAVDRQQVMLVIKDKLPQNVIPLKFMIDVGEGFVEVMNINSIKDRSHRGVAGNRIDAEELIDGGMIGSFLKGEQRRIFEREHG